jgi:hypothetical protein
MLGGMADNVLLWMVIIALLGLVFATSRVPRQNRPPIAGIVALIAIGLGIVMMVLQAIRNAVTPHW